MFHFILKSKSKWKTFKFFHFIFFFLYIFISLKFFFFFFLSLNILEMYCMLWNIFRFLIKIWYYNFVFLNLTENIENRDMWMQCLKLDFVRRVFFVVVERLIVLFGALSGCMPHNFLLPPSWTIHTLASCEFSKRGKLNGVVFSFNWLQSNFKILHKSIRENIWILFAKSYG